jgi:hypothetical protein
MTVATPVDVTAWADGLYTVYDNDKLYDLCDLNNPTLASIPKDETYPGKGVNQSLIYGIGGGGSASLAVTLQNTQASQIEEFVNITRKKMYEVALLDNEAIEASESDKGAFAKVIDEIDRKMRAAAMRVESRLHRGRGGWIGRLASGTDITNAAVITLDDKADAWNFYVGQKICFASTDGTSGSLRDSGETLTVSAVSRTNGTVTISTDLDDIASIADTDYIFNEGDFGACINSFYDWVPLDRTILGTSFYGVTRSVEPDRLAGLYYDGTGQPYHEILTQVCGLMGEHIDGGGHDYVVRCHPSFVTELVMGAQGKFQINPTTLGSTRKVDMGLKTMEVTVGANKVVLAPTWASRTDRMSVQMADTWKLKSSGAFPKFLNRTGSLHMMEELDAYQGRIGGYGNLICKAPGWNCSVKLAAVRTA